MTYSVTLQTQTTLSDDATTPLPVRVVMTVTNVVGFADLGIFTYQVDTVSPNPVYSQVATPVDLSEYLYQNAGGRDFVRLNTVDKTFVNGTEANDFITGVQATIQLLCNEMQDLSSFLGTTTVTITSV